MDSILYFYFRFLLDIELQILYYRIMIYIFDIDGTLTESRQPASKEFLTFFTEWMKGKRIYLVTGSDYPKAQEQLSADILNKINK